VDSYLFKPTLASDGARERQAASLIASRVAADRPQAATIGRSTQAALASIDRVSRVARYVPSVPYPDDGFGQSLQSVAGAIATGAGSDVFWVELGGFDTHADQGNALRGPYVGLMGTLDAGLAALCDDLRGQGLADDTLVLVYSEFGRRVDENSGHGTDHGAAGLMLALGGAVRGGIYGTAGSLEPDPENPALENRHGPAARDRLPVGLCGGAGQLAALRFDGGPSGRLPGGRARVRVAHPTETTAAARAASSPVRRRMRSRAGAARCRPCP
jgi:hypothetical protein